MFQDFDVKIRRLHVLLSILVIAFGLLPFRGNLRRPLASVFRKFQQRHTVSDRVEAFGDAVRERLQPDFERIGEVYPPDRVVLVGIKDEKSLEVWVNDPPRLLKIYSILGTSGTLGPKLREGDMQIPEGLYRIESLNPNSLYHLALRVNYPNAFDLEKSEQDGREDPGSDIMIHGKNCSIGCLAMGDDAAEELFVMAAETGLDRIDLILTPVDFRIRELPDPMPFVPAWGEDLYATIRQELMKLKKVGNQ